MEAKDGGHNAYSTASDVEAMSVPLSRFAQALSRIFVNVLILYPLHREGTL